MTSDEKISLKLKVIQEFKGKSLTLVEVFKIFDELKDSISQIAVEQELRKLKFKEKL